MKNQNMEKSPSEDLIPTTKSPSSSPPSPYDDVPMEDNPTMEDSGGVEVEGETLKTPMQVLEELTAGDNDDGSPSGGGGNQSGASVVVAMGGGSVVVEGGGAVVSEGQQGKKRKASEVKDAPTGTPTCPVCDKRFLTWKGAFGHMRKHPERDYRGFFKPPAFASTDPPKGDGGQNSKGEEESGEKKVSSPVGRLEFDLLQPMEEAGSSDAAERDEVPEPAAEEKVVEEGKKLDFDLNELPADEDDEQR